MIQFLDLYAQYQEMDREIKKAIDRVIKRSDFILGLEVGLFEKEFAEFCNTRYAIGLSSGTEALFLALLSMGIKDGDEVIVPAFTYVATCLAVSYTGAKPVFVDIDADTYNIDTDKIKKAISKNTKAIIPVHLYGQPANMPQILKIARRYNLKVIEDAAQAHGASIKMSDEKWRMVGGIGDIGCFSFYPSKNLGAMGDAGMIATDNKEVYKKILMLRDYGRISKYRHEIIGYNSRLDTLQAAILRVKLKRIKNWNKMRQNVAMIYNKFLEGIDSIVTPYALPFVKHVYNIYAIRTKKRDKILKHLEDNAVKALIHYPIPIHLQKAYRDLGYKRGDFPVSETVAQEIISLPIYPHLKENQVKFVAKIIKEALNK